MHCWQGVVPALCERGPAAAGSEASLAGGAELPKLGVRGSGGSKVCVTVLCRRGPMVLDRGRQGLQGRGGKGGGSVVGSPHAGGQGREMAPANHLCAWGHALRGVNSAPSLRSRVSSAAASLL